MSADPSLKGRDLNGIRFDLEDRLTEVEGDRLLLSLALEGLQDIFDDARRNGSGGGVDVHVDEDQITALTHAHCHLTKSVEQLSQLFHGKPVAD